MIKVCERRIQRKEKSRDRKIWKGKGQGEIMRGWKMEVEGEKTEERKEEKEKKKE